MAGCRRRASDEEEAALLLYAADAWKDYLVRLVRVFLFAFIGAFLPLVTGASALPEYSAANAALMAGIVGGIAAILKTFRHP
jgi:peroxiredoxin